MDLDALQSKDGKEGSGHHCLWLENALLIPVLLISFCKIDKAQRKYAYKTDPLGLFQLEEKPDSEISHARA